MSIHRKEVKLTKNVFEKSFISIMCDYEAVGNMGVESILLSVFEHTVNHIISVEYNCGLKLVVSNCAISISML